MATANSLARSLRGLLLREGPSLAVARSAQQLERSAVASTSWRCPEAWRCALRNIRTFSAQAEAATQGAELQLTESCIEARAATMARSWREAGGIPSDLPASFSVAG